MTSSGFQRLLTIGLLIFIAALYGLLSLWTPPALDDWIFMAEWQEINGEAPPSFSALLEFWEEIRLYDNGRLANTLSPLSTLLSPWKELFPIMTGILTASIVALVSFFSFSTRTRLEDNRDTAFTPVILTIVWAALFFLLPWRNSLFVADYSLNYIWGAAVTMFFMTAVMQRERKGWSKLWLTVCLLLAFFAGSWHEGFAVSTISGFLLYTLLRRKGLSRQWYLIGFFYAIVTLAFCLSPGLIQRSERELGVGGVGSSLLKIIFDFLPVVLLIGLIVLMSLIPSLRDGIKKAWGVQVFKIGAGIVVTGVILSLAFTHQPRSAFWPDIMAIVMLFILTKPIWINLTETRFGGYLGIIALASCLVPMTYILTWQRNLHDESELIVKKMEQSESGTVFHDIISSSALPFITLKMTNQGAWVTQFQFRALGEYLKKKYPAVVPKELETINGKEIYSGTLIPLGGNAGAFRVGNSIILPYATNPATIPIEVSLRNGETKEAVAFLLPYLTPVGNPLTYINIYNVSVEDIDKIYI